MKNINEYFDHLYTLERAGMKYDLQNITRILNSIDNPHKKFKSIHIAGTNGKGATASFIASILMEHGLKVGLFTSPHILKFNERIRINGKCISNKYIKNFINKNLNLIKNIKPSFFEVNTAIAFQYFADKKVDIAVVECGLGGRLDSTNVITPEVSVITQIAIDHTQYLGNTLEKIANEKLGIVKKGIDVVVSDNNKSLKPLFKKKINKKKLFYLDDLIKLSNINISPKKTSFTVNIKPYLKTLLSAPLLGNYQSRNAACGVLAVKRYLDSENKDLSVRAIQKGVSKIRENTGYRGRIEIIRHKGKTYIFDISHNPGGIISALQTLKNIKIDLIVFGMMADKDYKSSLKEVLKHSNKIIFTKPAYPRAVEPEILLNSAKKYLHSYKKLYIAGDLNEAINIINGFKRDVKTVLFIGSFFLISDAIKTLKLQNHFL